MTAPPRLVAAWLPLLRELLARDGSCRWPLRGDSMRPTLPTECEIDVVSLPPRVALGALVVFASGDALVAHRLVRRTPELWVTQGDNRRSPDGVLRPTETLGLVRAAFGPDGRRIWPSPLAPMLAWFWIARYHVLRGLRFLLRPLVGGTRT